MGSYMPEEQSTPVTLKFPATQIAYTPLCVLWGFPFIELAFPLGREGSDENAIQDTLTNIVDS